MATGKPAKLIQADDPISRHLVTQEAWHLTSCNKLLQISDIFPLHRIPHQVPLFKNHERNFLLETNHNA